MHEVMEIDDRRVATRATDDEVESSVACDESVRSWATPQPIHAATTRDDVGSR